MALTSGSREALGRLQRALEKRDAIRASETDALRIVDGAGDGFEDLEIDDFAGNWLVQTQGAVFPEWLRGVKQAHSLYWKRLGDKKPPQWIAGEELKEPFVVRENGLSYWIDFAAGYSQGLFLDQRENRSALREMAAGKSVLNCFAYTCAFGVTAAIGGARTTHIDLSKNYLERGRRNYLLNNVDPMAHEFIRGDVTNWLGRFARTGRRFDIVVLDPPTFSRDDQGRVFTIEGGFENLVRASVDILEPGGRLFCSSNQRGLSAKTFRSIIERGLDGSQKWRWSSGAMPPDFCAGPYLKACWLQSV